MATLKEVMCADIDDVFLNLDEFAEEITLDGRTIIAEVERTDIGLRDTTDERGPVVYDSVTIRCRKTYIDTGRYYPEKETWFNGEKWHVFSCDGEELVTLILYKERSCWCKILSLMLKT